MRELEADLFVQTPEGPNEPDYLKAERKRTARCFLAINALIESSGPAVLVLDDEHAIDLSAPSPGPSVEGIKPDPAHLIALKLNDPANFPAVTDKDIRFYIRGVPSAPLPKAIWAAMQVVEMDLFGVGEFCYANDIRREAVSLIKSALRPKVMTRELLETLLEKVAAENLDEFMKPGHTYWSFDTTDIISLLRELGYVVGD